jgi:hypothetical protein
MVFILFAPCSCFLKNGRLRQSSSAFTLRVAYGLTVSSGFRFCVRLTIAATIIWFRAFFVAKIHDDFYSLRVIHLVSNFSHHHNYSETFYWYLQTTQNHHRPPIQGVHHCCLLLQINDALNLTPESNYDDFYVEDFAILRIFVFRDLFIFQLKISSVSVLLKVILMSPSFLQNILG